ncbi:MAG TPA: class II fumarate hydratase [Chloroflexota bacterium]|nr:class II fumarate hydratase [Chloroflexota bacterium]
MTQTSGSRKGRSVPPRRVEKDSMGPLEVPEGAYYGASTMRAVQNFPISGEMFDRRFIWALGTIKKAAAKANRDLGLLEGPRAEAIAQAAAEVAGPPGMFDDQFVLDVFQTGSGTSTNTNANEVIANRATELLGGAFGSKLVHPNDDVNMGQSSNDVIPTAMHLATLAELQEVLLPAVRRLRDALDRKREEFWPVIKTGRTHLQDATPIRLGQEFLGYVGQMDRAVRRLEQASDELREIALGGNAVGTGINMHPEFPGRVAAEINKQSGLGVRETSNHFQAQSTIDNVVSASGAVRTVAVSLLKVANDMRWMGSGPGAGIGEIDIPAVQPGSSIMPGKVNPVIAEALTQVCAMVIGNDTTIVIAGQSGNFELNVMLPIATRSLLHSIRYLGKATANFADNLVAGLKATSRGPDLVESGLMLVTALAPEIGYDAAAALAKEAYASGRTIRDLARERTSLSETDLDRILDPAAMTEPGRSFAAAGG